MNSQSTPRTTNARLATKTGLIGLLGFTLVAGCQPIALTGGAPTTSTAIVTSTAQATVSFEETQQTAEASIIQTQLALVETITPIAPPTGIPATSTRAPFVPGIYEISYAPFGVPQAQVITSQWRDIVNGQRTYVYAGARKDLSGATPDTSKGLIGLVVYSADLSNSVVAEYEAPGTPGILTITGVNNYTLMLSATDGSTLYFDVPSREFLDSPAETPTAPTATPIAPISPTPAPPTGYPPPPGAGYPQPPGTAPVQTQVSP